MVLGTAYRDGALTEAQSQQLGLRCADLRHGGIRLGSQVSSLRFFTLAWILRCVCALLCARERQCLRESTRWRVLQGDLPGLPI